MIGDEQYSCIISVVISRIIATDWCIDDNATETGKKTGNRRMRILCGLRGLFGLHPDSAIYSAHSSRVKRALMAHIPNLYHM